NRQLERECRSAPGLGLNPDSSAHPADELAADVQAEPGAADPADHVRIDAIELLEDPALIGIRNTKTLVADLKADVVPVRREYEPHFAAVRRILDGVVEQIDEYLPHLVRV